MLLDRVHPTWKQEECFLFKIDAEGYDPLVLDGAEPLLRIAGVKFIVFEHNEKWAAVKASVQLRSVVAALLDFNYACAFALHDILLPLDPRFTVTKII